MRNGPIPYRRFVAMAIGLPLIVLAGCDSYSEERPTWFQKKVEVSSSKETIGSTSGRAKPLPGQPKSPLSNPPKTVRKAKISPRAGFYTLSAWTREGRLTQIEVPERGCRILDGAPARIWSEPGPTSIAALGNTFVAAGYALDRQGEQLRVAALSPGKPPQTLRTVRLSPAAPHFVRSARPGIAGKGRNQVYFAIIEATGSVQVGSALTDSAVQNGWFVQVSDNADPRFAPALAVVGDLLAVAWTARTAMPMRTDLALLDGKGRIVKQHEIAPPAMGAAAPVFVAGIQPPVLLVVDAREGYSPLLRVKLSKEGTPGTPEIRIPISMVFDPPELTAASGSSGTYLVYTGMGGAATTAVGLVTVDPKPTPPQALVRGTAYGMLYVAATAAPRAPVFAVDVPQKPGVGAARQIELRIIDARGAGPAAVLRGPDGEASGAALARDPSGVLALAFSSPSGVHVAWARCDDE
jgi:hypothetical protein